MESTTNMGCIEYHWKIKISTNFQFYNDAYVQVIGLQMPQIECSKDVTMRGQAEKIVHKEDDHGKKQKERVSNPKLKGTSNEKTRNDDIELRFGRQGGRSIKWLDYKLKPLQEFVVKLKKNLQKSTRKKVQNI